ncbi:hypothetical protein BOQ54_04775 [Chelatococcus daeguensis]|jgi:hypothetical protein|uniref:Uncharacterized protein n=1 Tax=Chelatococcus daeguensis TaxID=444444 RepID=A0AAC9JT41_9HYPH|nr:DUF6441 family protein [Chelatococcus daeguensis]APF36722.1 hypothetical protein BOQ54_04775 [Chelatococcus daeguensis]
MSPRLHAAIVGDLEKHMAAEIKGAADAATAAVRQAGDGLKRDWRGQITSAGLGQRLANTIRDQYYPKGRASISAAALVYSRASKIVDAFDRGVVIRSKAGFWLAIPTELAGSGLKGRRIRPGEWERRTGMRLRFVYRRGVPSLLVADNARITKRGLAAASRSKTGRGQVTAVIFLLVPQVTLRKRLDLDRAAREWQERLPRLVHDNWPEIESEDQ